MYQYSKLKHFFPPIVVFSNVTQKEIKLRSKTKKNEEMQTIMVRQKGKQKQDYKKGRDELFRANYGKVRILRG